MPVVGAGVGSAASSTRSCWTAFTAATWYVQFGVGTASVVGVGEGGRRRVGDRGEARAGVASEHVAGERRSAVVRGCLPRDVDVRPITEPDVAVRFGGAPGSLAELACASQLLDVALYVM